MIPILFTPSAPSASYAPASLAGVQLWLRGTPTSMSTGVVVEAGVTPTNGQTLASWVRPGDTFGGENPGHIYAEQGTAGDRPTVTVSGGVYTVNASSGDDIDIKDEGADANVSLTGDFCLWAVLTTNRSQNFFWAGNVTASQASFRVSTDGRVTVVSDTASSQVTVAGLVAASTRTLVRIRRVSDAIYVATSSAAEVNPGNVTGTITINRLLSSGGTTTTVTASIGEILVSTDATTAASPPASIDGANGWFKTGRYGSEPAWDLSI